LVTDSTPSAENRKDIFTYISLWSSRRLGRLKRGVVESKGRLVYVVPNPYPRPKSRLHHSPGTLLVQVSVSHRSVESLGINNPYPTGEDV